MAQITSISTDKYAFDNMPYIKNGKDFKEALAEYIGMKNYDNFSPNKKGIRVHYIELDCLICKDTINKIDSVSADNEIQKEKIIEFLKSTKFDTSWLPPELPCWREREVFFTFRNKSMHKARQEQIEYQHQQQKEYEKRLVMDTIAGFYIPQNLRECFIQLDKMLEEKYKIAYKGLKSREDVISKYYMGMGTDLRNYWGLWGGSRLQTYFIERGVNNPEDMSGVILEYYYDWLNGDKDCWKKWEIANPVKGQ